MDHPIHPAADSPAAAKRFRYGKSSTRFQYPLVPVMPLALPRDPPRPLDSERPLAAVRLWTGQMLAATFSPLSRCRGSGIPFILDFVMDGSESEPIFVACAIAAQMGPGRRRRVQLFDADGFAGKTQ